MPLRRIYYGMQAATSAASAEREVVWLIAGQVQGSPRVIIIAHRTPPRSGNKRVVRRYKTQASFSSPRKDNVESCLIESFVMNERDREGKRV